MLFTSLLEGIDPHLETTTLHISTIADSWIQISYALLDGERNRALSIIKSRGSKHSNQLRELIFSDTGITLANPYTAGGKVLLGTLRIEKENALHTETSRKRDEIDQKRREVELIMAERDNHLEAAVRDLRNRSEELDGPPRTEETRNTEGTPRKEEGMRDRKLPREPSTPQKPLLAEPASAAVKQRGKSK